jgi:hypothetical protein
MHETRPFQTALADAVATLLRPLIRLLLRHLMPFAAFEEIAKRVYIEVALTEFGIPGKRPSISRASILSGLTRKEAQRLLENPAPDSAATAVQYNRAVRVLTGWVRDPRFHDAEGEPSALDLAGDVSFAALVKRHSGDMPVRAVLDELLRVGAIRRRDDGQVELLQRAYVPQQSAVEKLAILGADVSDLIETIDHNIQYGATDPRFQRKVMYHSIPADALPAFRKLSAAQAQALLEKLDAWLAAHDTDEPSDTSGPTPGARSRVGVGIYYFEQLLEPSGSQ